MIHPEHGRNEMTEPRGVHADSLQDAGLPQLIVPVVKAAVPVDLGLEFPPPPG